MKKCLLFILLLTCILSAKAQTSAYSGLTANFNKKDIDSFRLLLLREKNDTARVNLLNLSARGFQLIGDTDSSLWYAQIALQLSQSIHYVKGEIDARSHLVRSALQIGNYPEALQSALYNLQLAEKLKDTVTIYEALRGLSFTYNAIGDYPMLLENTHRTKHLVHSGFFKRRGM